MAWEVAERQARGSTAGLLQGTSAKAMAPDYASQSQLSSTASRAQLLRVEVVSLQEQTSAEPMLSGFAWDRNLSSQLES